MFTHLKAAILVSALLTVGLTGCKFGNYEESQTNPDQWSGYYKTTPQSLRLCANTDTSACADVQTNLVPDELAVVMVDPVIFYVSNLTTGAAIFAPDTSGTYALPVYLGSDRKSLSYIGSTSASPLWGSDTSCTTKFSLEESGTLNKDAGRVSITFQIIRTFDGNCTDALLARQKCYLNSSDCGEATTSANRERQAETAELFDRYIDAKLMTADQISNAVSLGYKVSYE